MPFQRRVRDCATTIPLECFGRYLWILYILFAEGLIDGASVGHCTFVRVMELGQGW